MQHYTSGSGVRHKAVYLIVMTDVRPKVFKLPSLFASCLGVRLVEGRPVFDKIAYEYVDDQEQPRGVNFTEYALRNGSFVATGHRVKARFLDSDNFYRFSANMPEK